MLNQDVVEVKVLGSRRVELAFEDGSRGCVDLDEIIKDYQNIFAPLLGQDFFCKVTVNDELGTIVWPNGADICPDVLYAKVKNLELDFGCSST